jgi:hypothetical protein
MRRTTPAMTLRRCEKSNTREVWQPHLTILVIQESETELLQLLPVALAVQDRSGDGIQGADELAAVERIVVGCSTASR